MVFISFSSQFASHVASIESPDALQILNFVKFKFMRDLNSIKIFIFQVPSYSLFREGLCLNVLQLLKFNQELHYLCNHKQRTALILAWPSGNLLAIAHATCFNSHYQRCTMTPNVLIQPLIKYVPFLAIKNNMTLLSNQLVFACNLCVVQCFNVLSQCCQSSVRGVKNGH